VAAAGAKLVLPEDTYNALDFGREIIDVSLTGTDKLIDWMGTDDDSGRRDVALLRLHGNRPNIADGSALRELHTILRKEDPDFGGLERVQNKRREFLWVHKQFVNEY